jgi:uridylate kinase
MESGRPGPGRILLKLSGEALGGDGECFSQKAALPILEQIGILLGRGVQVALVVGGGNVYRGRRGQFPQETGDRIGMLATVANGLALREFCAGCRIPCLLQSALPLPSLVDAVDPMRAREALEAGRLVIFCGGTGLPYFSTDTAAALRALDIRADVLLKASGVDGVYTADPRADPGARRFDGISYDEVLRLRLAVMDQEALCLCRSHRLPCVVFSMHRPNALLDLVGGERIGTRIVVE